MAAVVTCPTGGPPSGAWSATATDPATTTRHSDAETEERAEPGHRPPGQPVAGPERPRAAAEDASPVSAPDRADRPFGQRAETGSADVDGGGQGQRAAQAGQSQDGTAGLAEEDAADGQTAERPGHPGRLGQGHGRREAEDPGHERSPRDDEGAEGHEGRLDDDEDDGTGKGEGPSPHEAGPVAPEADQPSRPPPGAGRRRPPRRHQKIPAAGKATIQKPHGGSDRASPTPAARAGTITVPRRGATDECRRWVMRMVDGRQSGRAVRGSLAGRLLMAGRPRKDPPEGRLRAHRPARARPPPAGRRRGHLTGRVASTADAGGNAHTPVGGAGHGQAAHGVRRPP